ncbi:MAG: hypothetical protein KGS73_06095 [Chloroflexi bacterium]|nr:hypothetical protein [Chloroflexota bacterium]
MRIIMRVTDSDSLSLRSGREASNTETLDYIPGRNVLGGLAEAHTLLRSNPVQFNKFFFSEDSTFGNLYPALFIGDELQGNEDPVLPLPATAVSCKRFAGFTFDEEDPLTNPHHGVYDTLIPWALFALSGEQRFDLLSGLRHCSHLSGCSEAIDRFDGFYRQNRWDARKIGKSNIRHGLRTRTGISRQTGAVAKGILYSRETLGPCMTFWGNATVRTDQFEAFREFVQEASAAAMVRFGNNRTRSMGKVVLDVDKASQEDTEDSLAERIQQFNQAFQKQALSANLTPHHAIYVPLTLISDVILVDRLLRYQTQIDTRYLQEVWGLHGGELVYQCNSTRSIMGWQGLLRLPRADEIAITMGSVFLFSFAAPLDVQKISALLRLQEQGVGIRRREGFGSVIVASPFHWEVKGQ